MRRIVWIAAALLVMVGIMGYAIFTMHNIEEVNKRRHEKNAGNDVAVIIAATTATTSVWDALRAKETTTDTSVSGEETAEQPQEGGEPQESVEPQDGEAPRSTDIVDSNSAPDGDSETSGFAEPSFPMEQTEVMTIIITP